MPRFLAALLYLLSGALLAQTPDLPPQRHIEVTLTPETGDIRLRDRLVVEGRDQFRFRLAPWLEIETLKLDGVDAVARGSAPVYLVQLPGNGRHELEFLLRGKIPLRDEAADQGLGSSGGADGVFLPGYDAWIPDDGSERIRYRLEVFVPDGQRVAATGKLVDERTDDGFHVARFELAQPGEAPSLFVGPYRLGERVVSGLRLRTYFHAELAELSEIYLDAAEAYIRRFADEIGDYPYDDFYVISAPIPVGLGFPNLTYVGRQVIPLPFMRSRSLAHEVLHNWWGNGVAVDYESGNWAEGLTTFMADYALERDKGDVAARSMRVKWLRDYAALPAQRDQPVRAFKSKSHQASQVIGYNKVAFIFHMLTLEIGQPAFDAGLREFWSRHRFGSAGWRDLQLAFETSAGRDLDWFFTQWLDLRGAPRPSLGAHSVSKVETGYRTSIEILQPVAGYRFRLPVLLRTEDSVERHQVTVSETLTRVEWTTSAKPEYIHFDPDSDVFRKLQRNETPPIMRDITLDPKTTAVIGVHGGDTERIARGLVSRIMDVEPLSLDLAEAESAGGPLLLITTTDRLARQLERLGLQIPADLPRIAHSASAWTARRDNGAPVLVVSGDDAAEVEALLRPLPHYGGQSYVLFAAGRALERGIWPITQGALFRKLGENPVRD